MKYKIGIIEDDVNIATLLKNHLLKYGFDVWVCNDFSNVDEEVQKNNLHIILLDINLPSYNGYFWCKKIRLSSKIPIIFVSARTMDLDQIYAMECGGDDYLTKPFSYEVVIAKINAHLRRTYGEYSSKESHNIEVFGAKIDTVSLKLQYHDKVVSLTKNERDILTCLFENYPKPAKRETLLKLLWDSDVFVEENTLNVNIGRARKRLKEVDFPFNIKAIRNVGYVMEKSSDEKNN